jgi:formylglycine-generating enzyme required for sulfatase activity
VTAALERARAWKGKKNRDWTPFIHTFEVHGIAFEMCLVPPGTFRMGDGNKAHPQTLAKPYWIARYPTTNAQWRAAVEQSGGAVSVPEWADWYKDKKRARDPVVGVTWVQCQAFVDWLGGEWTLPSEPEWEYAARGVENLVYPWGNRWNGDNAVWSGNSNNSTAPVGSRSGGVSWVGALDLSGSVWDWLRSAYADYPYVAGDGREEINRTDERMLRGGSFYDSSVNLHAAYRYGSDPDIGYFYYGFRCALS